MDNDYFGLEPANLIPNLNVPLDDKNNWKYVCIGLFILLGISVASNLQYKKKIVESNQRLCIKVDKNIDVQKFLLQKYKKLITSQENNMITSCANPQIVRNDQESSYGGDSMNAFETQSETNQWYNL